MQIFHATMNNMKAITPLAIQEEDQLVAELHLLGVTYLSNRISASSSIPRPPSQLLADSVCQPSSRVRTAVIPLLLLHPLFSEFIPDAMRLLNEDHRQSLMLFYTATVYLQRQYQAELSPLLEDQWVWLPHFFDVQLGLSLTTTPQEAIHELGRKHQQLTHSMINWAGTYENAVLHLIRYKQSEQRWNRLPLIP